MRRTLIKVLLITLLFSSFASAVFVNAEISASHLSEKHEIYKPGSILGLGLEVGFFNEPGNIVDYTLALGVRRFGYSHSDGETSVSMWGALFKPLVWSVTLWDVMLEVNFHSIGFVFATNNFNKAMELRIDAFRTKVYFETGARLGYNINEKFLVSLAFNYQYLIMDWVHDGRFYRDGKMTDEYAYLGEYIDGTLGTCGFGINFQWNAF